MKNLVLSITLILLVSKAALCQLTTLSFNYIGPDIPPPCNVFKDQPSNFWTQWKVSHGTPSSGDLYGQNTYTVCNLNAKWTGADPEKSEGLFINYNFLLTHTYDITISVAQNSGDAVGIDIFAATGVTESSNTTCIEDAIPVVSAKRSIYSADHVYDGPVGNFDAVEISNWSPKANFTQLWAMSRQKGYNQSGSLFVDEILIADLGVLPDNQAPTTPGNLSAISITTNSFSLKWTASTDDKVLIGYKIYRNGTEVASTSSVSYNFTGLPSCTHDFYEVKAYDSQSNLSAPAGLTVAIPTSAPVYKYLETDLSSNTSLYYAATNFIKFLPGFKYQSSVSTPGLKAEVLANCVTYVPGARISSNPEVVFNETTDISSIRHHIITRNSDGINLIYPNPTDNELRILTPDNGNYDLAIRNSEGEIVNQLKNQNSESMINVSTLPSGVYLIEVTSAKNRIIGKFIKK